MQMLLFDWCQECVDKRKEFKNYNNWIYWHQKICSCCQNNINLRVFTNRYTNRLRNKRLRKTPIGIVKSRCRTRLKCLVKLGKANKMETSKSIGCNSVFLVKYLESKFLPGMSWQNKNQWHIDHIKPLSSFNLLDKNEYLKACHYTNLQPLWAKDNMKKSAKYDNRTI